MVRKRNVHVVPRDGRWAVTAEGQKEIEFFLTKREAIGKGRVLAKDLGGELVIHDRTGVVRDKDSYGKVNQSY